jgi:hypothetical protein
MAKFLQDEFEGVEALEKAEPVQKAPGRGKAAVKKQRVSPAPSGPKHFYYEVAAVLLLLFYLTNYFIGGRRNEQYPRAFAKEFAEPGKVVSGVEASMLAYPVLLD